MVLEHGLRQDRQNLLRSPEVVECSRQQGEVGAGLTLFQQFAHTNVPTLVFDGSDMGEQGDGLGLKRAANRFEENVRSFDCLRSLCPLR